MATTLTDIDMSRWFDFRAGTSAEEIAARENVKLDTVMASLSRMRAHQERNSQTSAETAVREMFLERLPQAAGVFIDAMNATTTQTRTEVVHEFNEETGRAEWVDKEVTEQVPDHQLRLKAVDSLKALLQSVQPKTPMVQVDARSQTNFNNGLLGAGAATPESQQRAISFESIMRQRRLEMGLADAKELTAGDSAATEAAERDMDDDGVDDETDDDGVDETDSGPMDGELVDSDEDSAPEDAPEE
jgi:hypothetical protein